MTATVLKLVPPCAAPIADCEKILQSAIDHGLQTVLLLGFDKDGAFYALSSTADGGDTIYLCELFKHKLLNGEFLE